MNKLSTIFGIGKYTALVITAFTNDISNFDTVKEYTAFFGLEPRINDSGDESQRKRISKKGNSIVRKVLYTCVLSCIKNTEHPVSKMYYRLENKDKTIKQSEKSLNCGKIIRKKDESLNLDAPISKKERNRRKKVVAMSQKSIKDLQTRSSLPEKDLSLK